MKYLKFLALITLGVVSALEIEPLDDESLDLFDPVQDVDELDSEPGDVDEPQLAIGWPYSSESPELDEELADSMSSGASEASEAPEDIVAPEPEKLNKLSCPFSGEGCRFKKAKCVCETKDSKFKFVMKKFGMVEDDTTDRSGKDSDKQALPIEQSPGSDDAHVSTEESALLPYEESYEPLADEPSEIPIVEEVQEEEPSPQEIMQEIPSVVEGFESLDHTQDPQKMLEPSPEQVARESGSAMAGPEDEFEDKTIRMKTGDENDDHKKVHEYEYLRIKKLGENGVEEQHMETPETQNPAVSYHKGVMETADVSIKSRLSTVAPETFRANRPTGPSRTSSTRGPRQRTGGNYAPYAPRQGMLAIEGSPLSHPENEYVTRPGQLAIENGPIVTEPEDDYVPEQRMLAIEGGPTITEVEDENPDRLALSPVQNQLMTKEQLLKELKNTDLEIQRLSKEQELQKRVESAENIHNELREIEKRKADLLAKRDMTVAIYRGPTQAQGVSGPLVPTQSSQVFTTDDELAMRQLENENHQLAPGSYDMSVVPYTGSGQVALRGTGQSRSLKSKKGKKNKKNKKSKKSKKPKRTKAEKAARKAAKKNRTKEQKKADKERKKLEKKRRKELKRKSKKTDEVVDKRELERVERMREQEKMIDEKLDKLSEDLEDKQVSASKRAREVKSLQMRKKQQQRRIDMAERRMKMKREQKSRLEAKERLERIRKEQLLLKEQEQQIDQLSKDTEEGSNRILENNSDDNDDDE